MIYSKDLRQKVIEAYLEGNNSLRELAERFRVSASFVYQLCKRYKETGSLDPMPKGKKQKITEQGIEQIKQLLTEKNNLSQEELATWYENNEKVKVSQPTISRILQRHTTSKKNSSITPSQKPRTKLFFKTKKRSIGKIS